MLGIGPAKTKGKTKMETIQIPAGDDQVSIARVYSKRSKLAVTKILSTGDKVWSSEPYAVTHVPSGKRILACDKLKDARKAMTYILSHPKLSIIFSVDSDSLIVETMKLNQKLVAILRDIDRGYTIEQVKFNHAEA